MKPKDCSRGCLDCDGRRDCHTAELYPNGETPCVSTAGAGNNIKTKKAALKAARRLKTISGSLLRELQIEIPPERLRNYKRKLAIFEKILSQEWNSKNKIYSIHEPYVYCVAKEKDHKKHGFGSKVCLNFYLGYLLEISSKLLWKRIVIGHLSI